MKKEKMKKEKQNSKKIEYGFINLEIDDFENPQLQEISDLGLGCLVVNAHIKTEQITQIGKSLGFVVSEQNQDKNIREGHIKILEILEDIIKIARYYQEDFNLFYQKKKEFESKYYILKEKKEVNITLEEFLFNKLKEEKINMTEKVLEKYEKVEKQLKVAKEL